MKLSEIGQVFGLGSESGVTKTISRLGQRMENDAELLAEYNVLCQDLTPFGLLSCIRERMGISVSHHHVSTSCMGFSKCQRQPVGKRRMLWYEGYRKAVYGKTVRTV